MGEPIKLLEHQEAALEKLAKYNKCAIFMKAGQGKTFIAFEKFKCLKKVLVITTCKDYNSGRWIKESERYGFCPELHIINYEKLRNKKTLDMYLSNNYDGLIVDEAHHFKGNKRTGKVDSKAVYKLAKKTKYVIGLTGTPVPNNYVETYHILSNLDCNPFPQTSENSFVNYFYITHGIPVAWGTKLIPIAIKKQRYDELLSYINKVTYNYFPEDMEHINMYQYVDKELPSLYKDILEGVFIDSTLSILEKIQKLQQLANGFVYDNEDVHLFDTYKKEAIKEYVLSNKEDRFIFVYKYIVDLDRLKEIITELGIEALLLHSSQSEAMNLQNYNHIIFYSPSYSFKDLEQMRARIMRIGQSKIPKFTTFIRKNTIEDYIIKALNNKRGNFNQLKVYEEFKNDTRG